MNDDERRRLNTLSARLGYSADRESVFSALAEIDRLTVRVTELEGVIQDAIRYLKDGDPIPALIGLVRGVGTVPDSGGSSS